ncbi:hypothetical protein NBO_367g0002 [Nosema bombycis CQ1]|uniref:CTLH domain-containing protein n=1 Tax=Nosema bombycis (strain CQ1 / CVCC 102059) TaxID=578461 RepID=R0KPX8_NOSB1|nr:hypothetical protein NBO_367g0002 [Nosema bombycis CQ1]|eukprot:EOB12771.1 hypothetical protein NBO_367g0002 [Nosema bombycis CQ1]
MQNNIKDIENESDSVGSNSVYNEMVLNFISNLGYKDISSLFSEENQIKNESSPMLERRFKIREIIEKGDINNVITELNDINVELIDENYYLYYLLIQHKAYEKANKLHSIKNLDDKSKSKMILKVIDYLKEEVNMIIEKYDELHGLLEDFLEYLIFNSSNIKIENKRKELGDIINKMILEKYSLGESELERVVKGIVSEESTLSKTNKFIEFKKWIKRE